MNSEATEALVLFSGGMDSTACIHLLRREGFSTRGLFMDFGQLAAVQERLAVGRLSAAMKFDVQTVRVLAESQFGAGELLGRNAFLLMSGLFLGGLKRGLIAIGVHSGPPYFDCSPAFISRMRQVIEENTDGLVSVSAPLLEWAKPDIVEFFNREDLPLFETYSCEVGAETPCGKCASCKDRRSLGC